MFLKTSLCQSGPHTCFGCCGRKFVKADIKATVHKNTLEFNESKDLQNFKDRFDKDDVRACGVCCNLIFSDKEETKVHCPLHPLRNKEGIEYREGHCDISYACKSASLFERWDEPTRTAFIEFLKSKGEDMYTYSLSIDNNTYLKEFFTLHLASKKLEKPQKD